jgi:putative redox protein
MNIKLTRANDRVHFVARNPEGNEVHIDGSPALGGEEAGFRPMQLLLASLAGCMSMDLVDILRKQRAGMEDVEIEVTGKRDTNATPSPFTNIHVHFRFFGDVDRSKAERALDLAVNKYCSVGEMLSKSATIDYDYEVVSESISIETGEAG